MHQKVCFRPHDSGKNIFKNIIVPGHCYIKKLDKKGHISCYILTLVNETNKSHQNLKIISLLNHKFQNESFDEYYYITMLVDQKNSTSKQGCKKCGNLGT